MASSQRFAYFGAVSAIGFKIHAVSLSYVSQSTIIDESVVVKLEWFRFPILRRKVGSFIEMCKVLLQPIQHISGFYLSIEGYAAMEENQ
jgi:hypothetical protein